MAKPTLFTEELFEEILDLHAGEENGQPMTVADICRLPGKPKARTFYEWLSKDPELQRRFMAARQVVEALTEDEIRAISDTPQVGVTEKLERVAIPWTAEEKAAERENPGSVPVRYEYIVTERRAEDMLGHRRLRIEAREKQLMRWAKGRYGSYSVTVEGQVAGEGLPPPEFHFHPVAPKKVEE